MPFKKFKDNRGPSFGEKPVKEGETYDVTIEGIGAKGDGIAKIQGFVIVIPGVQNGDNVKVKVNAVRGKVAFGEVVGKGEPKPAAEEATEETEASETEELSESEEEPMEDPEEDFVETAEE